MCIDEWHASMCVTISDLHILKKENDVDVKRPLTYMSHTHRPLTHMSHTHRIFTHTSHTHRLFTYMSVTYTPLTYTQSSFLKCVYVWYCHEHRCMPFINTHQHIRLLNYTQATCVHRLWVWTEWQTSMCVTMADVHTLTKVDSVNVNFFLTYTHSITISTETATPPNSTKSRNSDASVQIQIQS